MLPEVVGTAFREATDRELLRMGVRDPRLPRQARRYLTSASAHAGAHVRGRRLVVAERSPSRFDPDLLTAEPPCLVRGFFPNERYFVDSAAEIDRAICLPPPSSVLPGDLPRPLVGVSFRRGDYVGQPWALPIRYQEAALERLRERVRPGTLLVFSDDAEFAELVLPRLERFGPAVNSERYVNDPLASLSAHSACDHFVIANSTFSWWGAWLAERRGATGARIVLAPAGWLHGDEKPAIVPDRWELVDWPDRV